MIEFNNIKIFTDNIDERALNQLKELDKTGVFEDQPIRIMPDVHAGAGCVIGFTAPIKNKIIPNLVGVDIGCGMLCISLGKVDIDFAKLDKVIRDRVPSGRNVGEFKPVAREIISQLRCASALKNMSWLEQSLGTLGGGNHFIEIDADGDGGKYLIIHSGSRNLGKQVAEIYQDIAVKTLRSVDTNAIIAEYKAEGRQSEINAKLKELANHPKLPPALCYLEGDKMEDYLHDMLLCTHFATLNREEMGNKILDGMFKGMTVSDDNSFTTRHNYIGEDRYIRKGAISAKKGERVLIPLNMRDGCIIGVGKGNRDWNNSAPHGAGRIMSRMKARSAIRLNDFKAAMAGIYTTTVSKDTIDEAPFAYKPSREIIELVSDTVDIERIIKPIYNFKAPE